MSIKARNPLVVTADGAVAVDVRIRIAPSGRPTRWCVSCRPDEEE
jgi:hypothetical protein